jgi:YfiH family protein
MSFIRPDWPAPANVIALSTQRTGGSSPPPYASLNLAEHVEDDSAAVVANRATLSRSLPANARLHWLTQVHGSRVVRAGVEGSYPSADASWTREPGQACVVMTADCLPVLFCSSAGDTVAAAHAGWRGLLDGVLENTVAAMGVAPSELLAWLGPAIGPAAFEVGAEVRAAFLDAAVPGQLPQTDASFVANLERPGYYRADLYALARLRLDALDTANVYGGDYCTYTEGHRFFSYRRDGLTGRMASLILLTP